jgi:hypothetical protein
MEEMIAHYEDTRSNTFFSQLINLKQKGSVTEHIENFQRLNKLSPKYYGPYKVLQKIGTMAYKLELPASSRVHLVFHVSCLKKVIGDKIPVQTIFPELDEEGKIILEPEAIMDTRIRQLRNRSISEYLIKWRKLPAEDSTWEDESFIQKHPELLKHCGQHLSQGEGHVKP